PQRAVALLRAHVAADTAVDADGGRGLQVPLADVMHGERLVREDARGADLDQVTAPLALENAVLVPAEVDVMMRRERAQIVAACVVLIEAHAAVARNAAIHLVVDERAEILIAVRALQAPVTTVVVAGHH